MQFSIYKIYKAMVRSSVNYLNILFIFVLHVWEFTIMYVTALGACQAQECLKRDSDPLELDVHRLLNWYMGSENWTSFFFLQKQLLLLSTEWSFYPLLGKFWVWSCLESQLWMWWCDRSPASKKTNTTTWGVILFSRNSDMYLITLFFPKLLFTIVLGN